MLIEENQQRPDNISQRISSKEKYLKATKLLIRMLEIRLSILQKIKQPKPVSDYIKEVQLLIEKQEQEQQQKNQNDLDIQNLDILQQQKTQKQNQIIYTSSKKLYRCDCHKKIFKTHQQLGGHMKWQKKQMNSLNIIE